jgi:hypothetical protein
MATPAEKLAESLEALQAFQEKGMVAIKTDFLTRIHRERILDNRFIREVSKGWYMIVAPSSKSGASCRLLCAVSNCVGICWSVSRLLDK